MKTLKEEKDEEKKRKRISTCATLSGQQPGHSGRFQPGFDL